MPLVRISIISLPLSDDNTDQLQELVNSLGGRITEEVITDKDAEGMATIIFDESLDN